jgi:hypothetical protein
MILWEKGIAKLEKEALITGAHPSPNTGLIYSIFRRPMDGRLAAINTIIITINKNLAVLAITSRPALKIHAARAPIMI